ncbi:MAG: hypothetical protein ACI9XR_001759 [Flavobacterium sp.]|jgi:hypothetical protein
MTNFMGNYMGNCKIAAFGTKKGFLVLQKSVNPCIFFGRLGNKMARMRQLHFRKLFAPRLKIKPFLVVCKSYHFLQKLGQKYLQYIQKRFLQSHQFLSFLQLI